MKKILKTYFLLSIDKYYGGKKMKFIFYNFIIPLIISIILYLVIGDKQIVKIFTTSSQELINAFSIISGFLLTSISITLATTKIDINNNNFSILKKNLKTDEKGVRKKLNDLRKILLYEVGIQFLLIIIITLLISLVKIYDDCIFLSFSTLLLGLISFNLIVKLLKNFLQFENIASFDLKK